MSGAAATLTIMLLVGVTLIALGLFIRTHGGRGLINGVDWNSVSNPEGLGRFVGATLVALGVVQAGWGCVFYVAMANHAEKETLNLLAVALVVIVLVIGGVLVAGLYRYQSSSASTKRDGRR